MAAVSTIVAASLIAGASAYQAKQAHDQRKDAKAQADETDRQQKVLEADLKDRQDNEESQSNAAKIRDEAAKRQRATSTSGGRASTLLTSPLSQIGGAMQSSGKTLIGQ